MTALATNAQKGLIHVYAEKAGMDEGTRRDFLQREAGVRSSKELTFEQAIAVIDKLKPLAGEISGAVAGLDSPVAKKLRALWIAGWNLGVVHNRTDRAMLAFLERQTKASHIRFLREPGAATAAIEALKSWLARGDAGVIWPADSNDVIAAKMSVLCAQWMRLVAIGAVTPFVAADPLGELPDYAFKVVRKNGWNFFAPADYDAVQAALGKKLRFELKRRVKP
jgi:hypothetical protein